MKQKISLQYRCAKGRIKSLIREQGYSRDEAIQTVKEEQWSNAW